MIRKAADLLNWGDEKIKDSLHSKGGAGFQQRKW